MKEREFIDWIRSQREGDSAVVVVGPGDDCAVLACGGEKLLVSTDQLLDGVHFDLKRDGAEAAGRKAMVRALSDLAAMAAKPLAAVATVTLPKGFTRADAEALYRGRRSVSDAFACPMVGGDVGSWSGPLAIGVTVFGTSGGVKPILRSGAIAGEALCVTGRLGGSWRTDRHLKFTPRIAEARKLAAKYHVGAMIDISDGLALDLWRLCEASGVGAEVQAQAVPCHDDAPAGRKIAPLQAALGDGEDYELLFTLPADQAEELCRTQPLGTPITRIGQTVNPDAGVMLVHADGKREKLEPAGWEHET